MAIYYVILYTFTCSTIMWMLFSLMDRIYRRKKSSGKVLLAKVISIIVLVGVNMYCC